MRLRLTLALALVGCGGAFTEKAVDSVDGAAATPDTSSDVVQEAADAGPEAGGSVLEDARPGDSAAEDEKPSSTCVHYPLVAPPGSSCTGELDAGTWLRDGNCWGVPLPPECACELTCACLQRHGANAGCMQGAGCFDTDGGPLLVCQ